MRILWFTNTPSLGANYLGSKGIGSGWIESLEAELTQKSSVQLGISFNLYNSDIKPFSVENTKYFPININSSKSKIKKVILRWSHSIENDADIQPYIDVIQQFKPDVIHIFGSESVFGLIASKTTVPCIIYLQGILTSINLKWFSGFTLIDTLKYSDKWLLLRGYGFYHDYLIKREEAVRENKIFKAGKFFIGRTDWDRRVSSVLSPGSRYFHCDEIMRPGFYSHQWQPQTQKTEFVIVSTVKNSIYKGLEAIYECKKMLNLYFPEYKLRWRIAGIKEGEEILYLIERKYKDKLINNNIQLLGPLQEDELINELLNADLFVHPSHIENSPNSVCEAMLLGMPVIATYAGGTPSIISDKKDGILVQDGDPYSLAGAIIELTRDRDLSKKLGENARIASLIRNDPKKIVNDLLDIYNTILLEEKQTFI